MKEIFRTVGIYLLGFVALGVGIGCSIADLVMHNYLQMIFVTISWGGLWFVICYMHKKLIVKNKANGYIWFDTTPTDGTIYVQMDLKDEVEALMNQETVSLKTKILSQ